MFELNVIEPHLQSYKEHTFSQSPLEGIALIATHERRLVKREVSTVLSASVAEKPLLGVGSIVRRVNPVSASPLLWSKLKYLNND